MRDYLAYLWSEVCLYGTGLIILAFPFILGYGMYFLIDILTNWAYGL